MNLPGFESREVQEIFFSQSVQTGSRAYPVCSGYWSSFLEIKQPGCDVGHSPASRDKAMNEWSCISYSHYMPSWHGHGQFYLLPFTPREGDLGPDVTIKITCELNSSAQEREQ